MIRRSKSKIYAVWFLPSLLLLLLMSPVQAQVIVDFDPITQTGTENDILTFVGNIRNIGGADVSLNAVSINITGLPNTIDTNFFYANTPTTLGAGMSTGNVPLFSLLILPGGTAGTYSGFFQIHDDSFTPVISGDGQVFNVVLNSVLIPETNSHSLLLLGVVTGGLLGMVTNQKNSRFQRISVPGLPSPLAEEYGTYVLNTAADIPRVRQYVRGLAHGNGFAEEQLQDLLLAYGELFANAVRHGYGATVAISTDLYGHTLQVRVQNQAIGTGVTKLIRLLQQGVVLPPEGDTSCFGLPMILTTADRLWVAPDSCEVTIIIEQDRLPKRYMRKVLAGSLSAALCRDPRQIA